jgi:deazaflavin-dependent oxidoreductase (nitroreductase family)
MGIAAELGYHHRPANPFQRAMQAFAGTQAGGWLFSRVLRHLDDLVGRVTRGRTSAPELLAGLPVLDLTSTGRKSGQPRTSHLISIPVGDSLALLGTNFGQSRTPAWVLNLEADPACWVTHKGRTMEARARKAGDAERAEVLETAKGIYGGYLKYLERITGREVRIFVLEPAA